MENTKIRYVCMECESDNIYFDSICEWDEDLQRFVFEVNEDLRGAECRDCHGSGAVPVAIARAKGE